MSKDISLANPSLAALPVPAEGPAWLTTLRKGGKDAFASKGIPASRQEDWRFTDLSALAKTEFTGSVAPAGDAVKTLLDSVDGPEDADGRLVIVNGKFSAELSEMPKSLPAGATLLSLADALTSKADALEGKLGSLLPLEEDPFSGLNTALMEDGYVLLLEDGAVIEKPIHIVYLNSAATPVALHPRALIVAGKNAKATLFESHAGVAGDVYFANPVLEVLVGEGATIGHYRLQEESKAAFHVGRIEVKLEKDAVFDNFVLSLGALIGRNNLYATLAGDGADLHMNGAYMARDSQHLDTTSVITHAVGNTTSEQTYKGVMDDEAQGVFQGKIAVARDAQKIEGNQLNRGLLLSEKCGIYTKPELEIFADDVKCSHGATIGELNAEALFYLRARGIDKKTAERMLVEAFVADVVSGIESESVQAVLLAAVGGWMTKGALAKGAEA